MRESDINMAIAEECGWKFRKVPNEFRYTSISPIGDVFNKNYGDTSHLPDYHGSLDACAEFERTLCHNSGYWTALRKVVGELWFNKEDTTPRKDHEMYPESATAPQRCEAFLRMRGRWVE